MIPPRLLGEIGQYEKSADARCGYTQDGEQVRIVVAGYRIPSRSYAVDRTDVLVLNTVEYPKTAFDMFYTPDSVRLKGTNALPSGTSPADLPEGRWLQWSIHPYARDPWDPKRDSFCTFMRHVDQRFRNGD